MRVCMYVPYHREISACKLSFHEYKLKETSFYFLFDVSLRIQPPLIAPGR